MKVRMTQLALVAATVLGFATSAYAFHEGGVAYCEGCHTMHNSYAGASGASYAATGSKQMTVNNPGNYISYTYLLQGSDQSSTCLKSGCHANSAAKATSKVVFTTGLTGGVPPASYTPGGDFAYLTKTYTYTPTYSTTASSSVGDRHGHNVIALDLTLAQDATLIAAPGGTYPRANLTCISCHDPHGKTRIVDATGTMESPRVPTDVSLPIGASGSYGEEPTADFAVGVYRLLGGIGYQPKSLSGSFAFAADPPIAVAPSTYNRVETTYDTRVAYGSGMSEWCQNCHTNIHNDTYPGVLRHPAGNSATLGAATTLAGYNAYVMSGDFTGDVSTAYSSLIPFEEGTTDRADLVLNAVIDGSKTQGADSNSNVMCLTCHRAHATGYDSITRWENRTEFLTVDGEYPASDATATEAKYGQFARGKTKAEAKAALYGREPSEFAYFQRSLCNKCHLKD